MVDPSDPSDPSGDNQEKSAATDIASQRSAAHFFRWRIWRMMKGQWHQHQWQYQFQNLSSQNWMKNDEKSTGALMCVQNHIKMWFPFICMHLLSLSTGPGVNGVGNTRGPQIQQNHGSSWKWGLQPGETLDGEEISWPNYIMLYIWPCIHKSKFQSTSKKSKTHRRSPWDGDGGRGGERERERKKK